MNKKLYLNKNLRHNHKQTAAFLLVLIVTTVLLLSINQNGQASPQASLKASSSESGTAYLPFAASSSRTGQPAAYSKSIEIGGALCPNDIAINQTTGTVYITNEYSDNVSLLHETDFIGNVATGRWPIWVESDPLSEKVYVSNVVSGVTVLEGDVIKKEIAPYHESYNITINPINGYTYVTDLHRPITIIQGEERIADLFVPNFGGFRIEWQLASDYDKKTGLTYFASWQKGAITVVDGLQVIDQFPYYGEGGKDMIIDSYRRLMYVANFRAGEDGQWFNNISIVNLDTKSVTGITTSDHSRHLAMDPTSGYVYATNPANDSVTVLQGTKEVATYQVGDEPWGVAVDPMTGYAYITNSGENSVSVFHDGEPVTKIELPPGKGYQPWQIAIDPQSHRVFIVNRSSKIKHNTMSLNSIECEQPWVHVLQ